MSEPEDVSMRKGTARFYPLRPGVAIPGDWYSGTIPTNIVAGEGTVIDSSSCFQRYKASGPCGLRVGQGTTIWRTSLAAETDAVIEIGDYCYLADCALACVERISIGNEVLIAAGVTIVDTDFHPFSYTDRITDTVALSPLGEWGNRPAFDAYPVVIGDGVRIGFNATILKGVTVGTGAIIAPGAVVIRDVPVGSHVAGNSAREIDSGGKP